MKVHIGCIHKSINGGHQTKKCFKMHKNTFSSKLGKYAIASFFAFDIEDTKQKMLQDA
jgi:hypothetical protein